MSLHRYPAYKDSGVAWLGEVPEHWEVLTIRRLSDSVQTGGTPSAGAPNSGIENGFLWYTPADFGDTLVLTTSSRSLPQESISSGDVKIFPKNSVLIVSIGATLGKVGFTQNSSSANQQINAIFPNQKIDGYFLAYSLVTKIDVMRFLSNASTIGIMNQEKTKDIILAVPSIIEQTLITQFLDRETAKIDDLIAEQEKLITLLDEKRQTMISHAVTKGLNPDAPMKDSGVEWLGEVPEHWSVCQFRRVISKIEQGWSPECESRPAEALEWGVLKSGCVNGGIFNTEENKALPSQLTPIPEYEVHIDDLLMSRASGSPKLIGSIALVKKVNARLMLSDKIFRLHLMQNKLMKNYMSWLGRSTSFRLQIEGAISGAEGLANNLPQSSIKKFWIVFPSLSEQSEIVTFLDVKTTQLDNLKAEAQRGIDLLKERRSALISAAVTGKIDVRGLTNTEAA